MQLHLLDFEALLARVGSSVGLGGLGLGRSIGHLNVGHVYWCGCAVEAQVFDSGGEGIEGSRVARVQRWIRM